MQEKKSLTILQEEMKRELANTEVFNALLTTTFKGLTAETMKMAIMDGMVRGFTFKDFRERNVYAIPYGQGYSLVTSIDHARKIGAKSGIIGEDEPIYGEDPAVGVFKGGSFCRLTVRKQQPDGTKGDFTAKVYFDEFSTGKNLWLSKPRVMIAKVAEMHALRKACPELAQMYSEEELDKEEKRSGINAELRGEWVAKVDQAKTEEELKAVWAKMPAELKVDAEMKLAVGTKNAKFKAAPPKTIAPAIGKEEVKSFAQDGDPNRTTMSSAGDNDATPQK